MNRIRLVQRFREIPGIVREIFMQLTTLRSARSTASNGIFEENLRRLFAEQLEPRSMLLLVRELSDGRVRFIIKDGTSNSFIHMTECA